MVTNKPGWLWLLSTVILLVIISAGILVAWLKYEPGHPIEIVLPPRPGLNGTVYLGGAVANPGLYPFTAGDSIEALIRAAGGPTNGANLSSLKLYIPATGNNGPQKIDINRADAWLLEALPDIGATLTQRIIDYRQKNGPFHTTTELLKVAGMGTKTYERIKDLISVGD